MWCKNIKNKNISIKINYYIYNNCKISFFKFKFDR